ncbi:ribose-5-phosphate isomerase RpiA [Sphingomonas sp. KR1UV-12]|uniref:Ribose 5-phosphate isomerase A n=1 Tax=Sphingomonas aurea TaxID=3063994 RepID=A0ABT9ENV5_9SPHN|nr:ribose-5-phosphate isomerase RpiA [Sphingomonas sp. KR1UV-12]MDP1028505.1 ribose-5-phosphate isomerase RpiA [Sphingomonas sp. KR1UV-12]
MDQQDSADRDKAAAAAAAVAEVEDGMLVGLGTGSTAAHAIRLLAARVADGLRITAVATSHASAEQARAAGIRVLDFAQVARVDLTIDGADRIDPRLFAIKGAGGAMLREKIVAAASDRMVVIADGSKYRQAIGDASVPVEVLPFALASVAARLGEGAMLRQVGRAPYHTDNGNPVLDWNVTLDDPRAVASRLDAMPGVLGHGLFLDQVDAAYVAQDGVVTRLEQRSRSH